VRSARVAPAHRIDLPSWRAGAVFGALALLFLVLAGRSLYLQGVNNDFLRSQGEARYSRLLEVPAHRGRIVDRHGEALAISTQVKSLWAFPDRLQATPAQWQALAKVLEVTPQALKRRVGAADDFVYVARRLPPETAQRAMALRITGLHEENEFRRYYPGGEILGHVLGFTGDRDLGQEGIELAQQAWLGGRSGSRRVIINRRGDVVEDVQSIREPQAGRDLVLSIDSRLQALAFRELKAAVEQHKARAGGLVMIDVTSGEILALANLPAFNPNRREKLARDRMRNRALTDVFEPGSTLKPFTVAAALEAGTVRPDTVIDTQKGFISVGGATLRDAHPAGPLTVAQIVQKSSNVGSAKLALGMPAERLHRALTEAGFGASVQSGYPGEVPGRVRPAKSWKPVEQATISYGHGISTNLVQLARAYTIFATDGELVPVTLMKAGAPAAGRQVLRPETARTLRAMLETVTRPGGTAPKAQVVGYRVAGKTGTAHKLENGRYADRYLASFVGFAPVSSPRIVVAVMIDEPSGGVYYGGSVAAPVFSNVVGASLRLLGVPADAPSDNVILPPDGMEIREET